MSEQPKIYLAGNDGMFGSTNKNSDESLKSSPNKYAKKWFQSIWPRTNDMRRSRLTAATPISEE